MSHQPSEIHSRPWRRTRGLLCLFGLAAGLFQGAHGQAVRGNHVLDLDGKGSYVELPSNVFNDLTEATVEGWVKWRSLPRYSRFFDFGNIWRCIEVCQEKDTNTLYLTLGRPPFTQGSELKLSAPNLIKPGAWCHVALTMGNQGVKLYFNGTAVASSAEKICFSTVGNGDHNYLGRSNWYMAPYKDADLDGELDDVRVWRTQRSDAQIRDNMSTELTGTEDGLVSLWKFEDGANGVVTDSGPGGHHGKSMGNARLVPEALPAAVASPASLKNLPLPSILICTSALLKQEVKSMLVN